MSDIMQQWCATCGAWKEHGTWQHMEGSSFAAPLGSADSCIACPQQVRNLYAVAFNLLNLVRNSDFDPDRLQRKLPERIAELQDAVEGLTPFIESHFANKEHAERGYQANPPNDKLSDAPPKT